MANLKISFNTGRLYTARGQVITAEWYPEEEKVLFNDHSRGVCGRIDAPEREIAFRSAGGFAQWVMNRYDRNAYRWELAAMNLAECEKIEEFGL